MTSEAERTLVTDELGATPTEGDATRIDSGEAFHGDGSAGRRSRGRAGRRARGGRAGKHRRRRSFVWEVMVLVPLGFLLVVLVRAFVIQPFYIPSGSMELTLKCNDRVLVNRLAYLLGDPARGDVIVFRNWDDVGEDVPSPSIAGYVGLSLREGVPLLGSGRKSDDLIKRIVALPGETVEVRSVGEGDDTKSVAYVNGKQLDEPYVFLNGHDPLSPYGPVVVPEGKYFVMGDHRNNSRDSRRQEDGLFVDRDAVIGKAFVRAWPLSRFGSLDGPADDTDAMRPNC